MDFIYFNGIKSKIIYIVKSNIMKIIKMQFLLKITQLLRLSKNTLFVILIIIICDEI